MVSIGELLGLLSLTLLVVPLLGLRPADAQEAPITTVAHAQSARAVGVDPDGHVYVADAGSDVIRILDRSGRELETLGGSGTQAGAFDDPAGLDPTNGQTLLVADAGNGRIQRFSAERQYLEATPVGRAFREGEKRRVFDDGRDGTSIRGTGRPIAVLSSPSNATFLIDSRDDVVVKWNEQRQFERVVGRGWDPSPQRPVALALDGSRRLFVADRGTGTILAYDLFGTFIERLPLPHLSALRALTVHGGRLWIGTDDTVFVWFPSSRQLREIPVQTAEPILDLARQGSDLFLLTESRLVRRPVDEEVR